jgi:hypothetical protein
MKRSSGPRKTADLSASLNHLLNGYVLAATAAGVGALALAQPADAKIVYTPAHVEISGKPLPIDLNHDGVVDFFLFHYGFHSTPGGDALLACLNISEAGSRTFCGSSSHNLNAFRVVESKGNEWGAAVQPGAKIIGGDRFRSGHSANLGQVNFLSNSHSHVRWSGPWVNGGKGANNRYVGIKFQINGRFHFGWARLTVTTETNTFTATLTGYAFETIPGKGIVAGQTKGADDGEQSYATPITPTPEPTLGALAMGAPGLSIWRRKETSLDGQ